MLLRKADAQSTQRDERDAQGSDDERAHGWETLIPPSGGTPVDVWADYLSVWSDWGAPTAVQNAATASSWY